MAFITRAEWGAAPPRGTGNALGNPTGVTIHWEGPKIGTRPHSQCAALVRSIQKFHQDSRGWSDIAYNLVGCEHGDVFEGRGAQRGNAANGSTESNLSRYSMCALTGQGDPTPDALKAGIIDGIAYLRRESGRTLPTIDCHSDHFATTCPGPDLRAWVKSGVAGKVASPPPASAIPTIPKIIPKVIQKVTRSALSVDGVMGPATVLQWTKVMGTPAGTAISQPSLLIRAVQKRCGGVTVDGYLGPQTWKAIQRRLGVTADGVPGPVTIEALQRRLNGGQF